MISVDRLTKKFGGFIAVNGVNFSVDKGEFVGLIGPNGSGKSTIFNLIAGTLKSTTGSISFEGQNISGFLPHKICHLGIARTFQIPRPFRELSILENCYVTGYYGQSYKRSRKKALINAEKVLEIVDLHKVSKESVEILGAAGLKKLELARALSTEPHLLLADESLGGLDEKEMKQAAVMLENIRSEMKITIIWVEHIMGVLMRVVDRVMVLDYGKLIFDGTPHDAVNDLKVVEVYLGNKKLELTSQN